METIRLILVDDHNLFHQSIGQSLKKEERFTVVAQADSGESAIGLLPGDAPTRENMLLAGLPVLFSGCHLLFWHRCQTSSMLFFQRHPHRPDQSGFPFRR